uniref:Ubiquitin carboxyl-terminal hydrolase n=1 Tax=Mesocestoides corti TaxID=53468 RepID=A0A5K3EFY1_MESCO
MDRKIDSLPCSPINVDNSNHFPGRWMPPEKLYGRIRHGDSIFIVDVRSNEQYSRSKINIENQVNLCGPLSAGATKTALEKKMSENELRRWMSQASANLIVLLDEKTGDELIDGQRGVEEFQLTTRHPLKIIFDALVTYNAEKHLLPSTVFLAGGFEEFQKRYPSLVTNTPVPQQQPTSIRPAGRIGYPSIQESTEAKLTPNLAVKKATDAEPADVPSAQETQTYEELLRQLHQNAAFGQLIKKPEASSIVPPVKVDRSTKPRNDAPTPPVPSHQEVGNRSADKNLAPEVNRSTKPLTTSKSLDATNTSNDSPLRRRKIMPLRPLRRGLVNLGNMCYMNSTLQSLLHAPHFWSFFMTPQISQPCKLARSLSNLVVEISDPHQTTPYNPKAFKAAFEKLHPTFAGFQQQDSHEFLVLLLDSLHEDLNKPQKTTIRESFNQSGEYSEDALEKLSWSRNRAVDDSEILDWFNGHLRSTIQCRTCDRRSYTFDEFRYLSVSVRTSASPDLDSCIEQFFSPEQLSGGSCWMCPQCKVPREAVKTFDIWRLPEYLIIHLKRFQCHGVCEKIESNVRYPLNRLDLSKFTGKLPASECIYDLFAITNHYGTLNSGHYVAFCFDAADQKWLKFDDSHVTTMSKSDVQTSAAYVLFYRRSRSST